MGTLLWIGSGTLAFFIARIIPTGRTRARGGELAAALGASLGFGVIATAFDFGGWKELDWRPALFAFIGAFAAAGIVRAISLIRTRNLPAS